MTAQDHRLGTFIAEADQQEGGSVGARRWTERTMEFGQHAIALVLTLISCIRAVSVGAPLVAAIAVSLVFLAWYALGAVRAARSGALVLAKWWLIVLAVAWLCTLLVSAEFIWVAFLLWLLAGHLFSLRIAIVFTALTYIATVVAPLAHYGQVPTPSIIGSLIGAVFALGLSRGYIELLREGRRREELLRSLELAHQNLLDLQDELALTQRHAGEIEERTRVSRDIHDTIAQSISSIRLIAHAEADRTTDEHAGQVLAQVEDLAAQSSRDVRRIIAALAPAELEDGALTAAIRRLLTRLEEDSSIAGRLDVDETLP
ncbi:MAG TPA: histidine kinase, partial [Brevibacterium linens]|nr:histidine kinase [Brevibacterium linens]